MAKKILIADDNENIREALTYLLEDEGYQASAAESGEACLEELARQSYDLLLLDVWLTGMDENRGGVRFQGQSNSLAAVADFIGGLQRSGWFPQVDLGTAQEQQNLVNFTVTGTFKDPEVAAKEKAVAAAAAAAPPSAKSAKGKR